MENFNEHAVVLDTESTWLLEHVFEIEEVVAIVFYGRSGSVFLQSLLDSHPQVLMIPGTVLMVYAEFWTKCSKASPDLIIERFGEYFACLFDVNADADADADAQRGAWKTPSKGLGFDKMGANQDEKIFVDKARFLYVLKVIFKNNKLTRKSLFQAIHVAYAVALGRATLLDKTRLPLIIYQLHSPGRNSRLLALAEDFPSFKIIQMVREPFQTLGSHFKHHFSDLLVSSCNEALHDMPNQGIAVRLEDLHTDAKQTLQKVADWLGISWHDSLLLSTFDGKQWWNLQGTNQVSGFNKVILSKDHSGLFYHIDRYRLKIMYGKRLFLWRYADTKPSTLKAVVLLPLLMLPFKMEFLYFKILYQNNKRSAIKYLLLYWRRRLSFFKIWLYVLSPSVKEFPCL